MTLANALIDTRLVGSPEISAVAHGPEIFEVSCSKVWLCEPGIFKLGDTRCSLHVPLQCYRKAQEIRSSVQEATQ